MLILTRKSSESLVIADTIEVTVVSIDGDRVKLGITAPKEVSILRKELCIAIGEENRAAAAAARTVVASALRDASRFRVRRPPDH